VRDCHRCRSDSDPDLPTSVTPPCGCTTTFTYDDRGNVLTETKPGNETTIRTYDEQNNLLTETDARGNTTGYAYDEFGQLTGITDAAGEITTMGRDDLGRIASVTDARGNTTAFTYESAPADPFKPDRPRKVTFANSSSLEFEYNTFGQVTRVVNEAGDVQRLITDEAGLLRQRRVTIADPTDPLGIRDLVTYYDYNDRGELTSVTNPRGETTTMEYGANSRLRFRKFAPDPAQPADLAVTEFKYDELGRLIEKIDPLNRSTQRIYRGDGLIATIIQADNTEIHFEYDDSGNRTAVVDPEGNRTEFRYDGNNRITERIQVFTASGSRTEKTEIYEYDPAGNLDIVTDRLGRIRDFDYDELNRLITEKWFKADGATQVKQIDLDYDAVGNLVSATDDNKGAGSVKHF